ncbi:MAG: hypothetical protein HC912_05265, partial [Saprospiraceae bacterium]|nr:hypothetical protein [Saprospiraceae bacterium]
MRRCGGAWFNHGKGSVSNPIIRNCTFMANVAREGAAIYNYADEGNASPQIVNCEFVENKADIDGGAIYNHSRFGQALLSVRDSKFIRNKATYGGGISTFQKVEKVALLSLVVYLKTTLVISEMVALEYLNSKAEDANRPSAQALSTTTKQRWVERKMAKEKVKIA